MATLMQRLLAAPGEDAERMQKTWSVSGSQEALSNTPVAQQPVARWRSHRSSFGGSEMSLNSVGLADGVAVTPSAFSSTASGLERCHLTDSPLRSVGDGSSYFKQPPSSPPNPPESSGLDSVSSCTVSLLDLAVDHMRMSTNSPVFHSPAPPTLPSPSGLLGQRMSHHGSAPNLCSPPYQTAPSPEPPSGKLPAQRVEDEEPKEEELPEAAESIPAEDVRPLETEVDEHSTDEGPLVVDVEDDMGMNSMSARTEALANTSLSSFKLKGRSGRHSSSSGANA